MPPFRAAISSTSKESNGDVSAVTNYCDKTVSSEVNCTKQPTEGEKLWSRELIKMVDSSVEFAEEPHDETTTTGGERQVEKIARKELRVVLALRCVVLLTILCACVIISTFTYYYLRGEDVDDYMLSYKQFVETVEQITTFQMSTLRDVFHGVGESFTATSINQNATFPFVTYPMFEVAGKNARTQSGVEFIVYAPLVSDKSSWLAYAEEHKSWLEESFTIVEQDTEMRAYYTISSADIQSQIFVYNNGVIEPANEHGPWAPAWHTSPPPFNPPSFVNLDVLSNPTISRMLSSVSLVGDGLMSEIHTFNQMALSAVTPSLHNQFHEQFVANHDDKGYFDHPHSLYVQPVYGNLGSNLTDIVGVIVAVVAWDRFLADLLPDGVNGIYAVLQNNCAQSHTYLIDGPKAHYLGEGDHHNRDYDDTKMIVPLTQYLKPLANETRGHCIYSLYMYSSPTFEKQYRSRVALFFAIAITAIFAGMALAFVFYDRFVRRRNDKVVSAAAKSDAILSSLFPSTIRDRLFAEESKQIQKPSKKKVPKARLRSYLASGEFTLDDKDLTEGQDVAFRTKPIADFFPETTIMFGDIVNFTAWSSVREPSQVFTLLETLYHAFDELARRKRVFKVETIGDCYVAVTGLPDPQPDHAVIMARFARACLLKMRSLTKRLEVALGPDTGDLAMRIGLHSGPVTAGVLRGERSRFQLFGDTMNTASRMESTGKKDKIQISQDTATLLIQSGKSEWIVNREDTVVAKGKGELQTYWLSVGDDPNNAPSNSSQSDQDDRAIRMALSTNAENIEDEVRAIFDSKTTRLIEWNVDVLLRLLQQIVARRSATPKLHNPTLPNEARFRDSTSTVLEEVKEIITLPKFNPRASPYPEDAEDIELSDEVVEQLHDFVCNIAAMYKDNAFHSFEHASHVTMSVTKLLSRIVAPSSFDVDEEGLSRHGRKRIAADLHDHTYGITSDPLTQFACVFSALVHDVDHTGVPNTQLVRENTKIARHYKGKSVAEQNSVDLAWSLLMDQNYKDLRAVIYRTDEELCRFRQLVVNSVMATDIVDKELKALRNLRWDRAFAEGAKSNVDATEDRNRKATIVIEHLIQASDVAHTMQHWHIYRKWNERFFVECYEAYKNGRAADDPAEGWYFGEIGFFDFYIIPLARKLKDCGVFGVSSDEYLNYAIKNREEWEIRGREIVDEMLEKINKGVPEGIGMHREPIIISSPQLNSPVAIAREA